MLNKLFYSFSAAARSGLINVLLASSFSYLITFCASIAYAHLLQPNDFGIYSFCYTIITFCLLINGFGAASGVLHFVSKINDQNLQMSYLKYAMRVGIIFNIILSFFILIYAIGTSIPIHNSKHILIAMSFFPVGRIFIDIFIAFLRATQQNSTLIKFSITTNSIILFSNIIGIYIYGLIGLIFTTYLGYLVIIMISILVFKLPNILTSNNINIKFSKAEFFNYSIYTTMGNAFVQLLFNLDILILGYVIKDPIAIANYKIATIIPFALNFIPGVIATFYYPIFAKNTDNIPFIRKLKNSATKTILTITIPTSVILIVIAHPLINIIFSHKFSSSILPFQILISGFSFAAMRTLHNNMLISLGKVKFAMWFNIMIAIINIAITYTLVNIYGIIGASYSIVIIYIMAYLTTRQVVNTELSKIDNFKGE